MYMNEIVPIYFKFILTVEESAKYFHIGTN